MGPSAAAIARTAKSMGEPQTPRAVDFLDSVVAEPNAHPAMCVLKRLAHLPPLEELTPDILFPLSPILPLLAPLAIASMRALGTAEYLHQPYFQRKKMGSDQMWLWIEERKWAYRCTSAPSWSPYEGRGTRMSPATNSSLRICGRPPRVHSDRGVVVLDLESDRSSNVVRPLALSYLVVDIEGSGCGMVGTRYQDCRRNEASKGGRSAPRPAARSGP